MMSKRKEIIETLSALDISKMVEQKMNLNYLSWANAWALLIQYYPDATYRIIKYPEMILNKDGQWSLTGRQADYYQSPAGVEVSVEVDIEGEKFTNNLYVMDNRNRVIKNPDYAQINKTQQRCLVKALALAGLGLNLYQGEDLPTMENIERNGLSPQQTAKKREYLSKVNRAKNKMSELLQDVARATKQSISDVRKDVSNILKEKNINVRQMNTLEALEVTNDTLREMKAAKTGENNEQLQLEEA